MAPAVLSQEFVQDSASEDEDQVASQKTKRTLSNGDSRPNKSHINQAVSTSDLPSKTSTTTGSDSETTSESDSSLPEPSAISKTAKRKPVDGTPASQPSKKKSKQSKTPQRIPPITYHPPSGYESLRISTNSGPGIDSQSLQSSQIWHIVAPANVPLTTIKSLDIAAVLRGDPIMKDQDAEYNMQATSTPDLTLLLPTNDVEDVNVEYQQSKIAVSRSFHLRELTQVKLPKQSQEKELQAPLASKAGEMGKAVDSDGHNIKFTAVGPGYKKTPRQQPKGLTKRYHPYGSTVDGNEKMRNPQNDDQAEASEEVASNFITPPSSPMQLDQEGEISTPKKHKKNKKQKMIKSESQQSNSPGGVIGIESPEKRRKKEKKERL